MAQRPTEPDVIITQGTDGAWRLLDHGSRLILDRALRYDVALAVGQAIRGRHSGRIWIEDEDGLRPLEDASP